MRAEARLERMLAALPLALRGGPRLAAILRATVTEFSGGEQSLERAVNRLLRGRWPALARGWSDPDSALKLKRASELGRIAALYGTEPLDGESCERFRQRLRAHVLLHRRGLTTAPALLELAAAIYLPDEAPTIAWEGSVAVATFVTRDALGVRRSLRLELIDNPPRRRSVALRRADGDAPTTNALTIDNRGLAPATPTITLTAASTLAVPEVLHVESDLRLVYLGTLAPGDRLEIARGRAATVNGHSARVPVVLADPATFDEGSSLFSYEAVIDGEVVHRGARFARADRWSPNDPAFFALPCGTSQMRCRAVPRDELRRLIDHWPERDDVVARAFTGNQSPTPLRLDLRITWREAQAATFALRVPADVIPWHRRERPAAHWTALAQLVDRGRAAGVRGVVELRPPPIRESLAPTSKLALDVRLAGRERLDLRDDPRVAGAPALTPGIFDRTSFGGGFADAPRDAGVGVPESETHASHAFDATAGGAPNSDARRIHDAREDL